MIDMMNKFKMNKEQEEDQLTKEAICNILSEREGEKELLEYVSRRYNGVPLGLIAVKEAIKGISDETLKEKIKVMYLRKNK